MKRIVCLLAVALTVGLSLTAVGYGLTTTSETYPQLLTQVDSGSVATAVVNRRGHDVKVTLRDSSTDRVVYPSHDERALVARLKAHGAHVKFTRLGRAPAHHVLRYVGGAIVLVIIAAGGGMFLYTRRRPSAGGPAAS